MNMEKHIELSARLVDVIRDLRDIRDDLKPGENRSYINAALDKIDIVQNKLANGHLK